MSYSNKREAEEDSHHHRSTLAVCSLCGSSPVQGRTSILTLSSGVPTGTLAQEISATTVYSEKVEQPMKW